MDFLPGDLKLDRDIYGGNGIRKEIVMVLKHNGENKLVDVLLPNGKRESRFEMELEDPR